MPPKIMKKRQSRFTDVLGESTDHALITSKHLVPCSTVQHLESSYYRLVGIFHHSFVGVSVAEQHYIVCVLTSV